MCVSHMHITSLYYKERRQLKTFLTHFGSALSLMLDPPVRLHDDNKRWNDHKNHNGERFCQKANTFVTHSRLTHRIYAPVGPTHP
jgi:hypothetical protein